MKKMTQENKHTVLHADLSKTTGHCGIAIRKDDGCIVVNVYVDEINSAWGNVNPIERPENKNSKALAYVFSAAPEMLAEMEKLAQALEDTGFEPPQSFYDVIKKARGM